MALGRYREWLLGLAPVSPDDPVQQLADFRAIVVHLIQTEALELAERLAQRFNATVETLNGHRAITQEAAESLLE